jgi:hypothetical protein
MEVSGQLHSLAALPVKERAHCTHWTGDWVGPRPGLVAMEKRKIACPCRESNRGRPASSPPLYQMSEPRSNYTCGLIYFICILFNDSDNNRLDRV